jgi:hypothetical protein
MYDGFWENIGDVMVPELLGKDLRYLASGSDKIDLKWLRIHCKNNGISNQESDWFWRIWNEMSLEESQRMLMFITLRKRLPNKGEMDCENFRITLERKSGAEDQLPESLPYCNTIYLPEYTSYEEARRNIRRAVRHSGRGLCAY